MSATDIIDLSGKTQFAEQRVRNLLLSIKDAQTRRAIIHQARTAVDKAVHVGGAFSSVVPLVSLYYGGILRYDAEDLASTDQDYFVLSKGHAVAAVAAIHSDIGFFGQEVLENSRSFKSILNGHPGPILPGTHISTGPMGQGLSVAVGFALAGRNDFEYDVYTVTGDGELQEGNAWEGIMYAGSQHLQNICAIVDHNHGQLDNPRMLHYSSGRIADQLASFGWRVETVDGTRYQPMMEALERFKYGPRDGRPTAIVSETTKGYGGRSSFMVSHKVTMPDEISSQEIQEQEKNRALWVGKLEAFLGEQKTRSGVDLSEYARALGEEMHLSLAADSSGHLVVEETPKKPAWKRTAPRDKAVPFEEKALPYSEKSAGIVSISDVITAGMKHFARSGKVVSVDADLSSTSGLQAGVGFVDVAKALNAGVAEANMICLGEAFASLGYNTWVSTFCPFFNFNVMRRIAIGHQERLEAIADPKGWLSEGHGLDLVFLATAANFDTKTNGATHMGNDDNLVFSGIGHLKIVDFSCPNQFVGFMRWVMEGNRGLVYARIMRAGSPVLYDPGFTFDYGKGYFLSGSKDSQAYFVTAGRQVHECLAAAESLGTTGVDVAVLDIPSVDEGLLLELYDTGKPIFFPEQNNGYLYTEFRKLVMRSRDSVATNRIFALNPSTPEDKPQFVHSGDYGELIEAFGLAPEQLVEFVQARLGS
ncbi:MAG: transketolase C-terminal domain-containing protein [Spirochaetota bacterium]